MRRRQPLVWGMGAAVCLGAVLAGVGCAHTSAGGTDSRLREELRQLIGNARDRVFPALVNIHAVTARYRGGLEQKGRSVGSGTIISADGYVLTNEHVTSHGRKFTCTLADRSEVLAELVGEDPLTDLAVLKLDLKARPAGAAPVSVAGFGSSEELQIGDYVMAMGSPFALSRSVTLGIVSNPERILAGGLGSDDPEEMELEPGQRTGLFTRWIQHDALINPGNSGGPLVNLKGEVVGVNELGGSSIGFAIPSKLAQIIAQTLIEHREVPRSWIGAGLQQLDKTGLTQGVLINSVVKGSPADSAGLQPGDVLLKVGPTAITARFAEEIPPLMQLFADLPRALGVDLTLVRKGKEMHLTLTPLKLEKDRGDERLVRGWGLTVEELTDKSASELHLAKAEGVLVTGVRDGGPAALAEPSLSPGDVLRSIDGKPVKDLAELLQKYRAMSDATPRPEVLLFEFDRRGENEVTLLKPKVEKEDDPSREVAKGWIGVATQPITAELADRMGQKEARGFRVARVYPGTQAEKAGLQVGDVIASLDGEPVTPQGIQDSGLFARTVRRLPIGETAKLELWRAGKQQTLPVTVERTRLLQAEARRDKNTDFDIVVRELTFFDRDELHLTPDVRGVVIAGVDAAGWAGLGGLRAGDLIQSIDGHDVKDLASYREAMAAIVKAQPTRLVVVVVRGVRVRYQFLEPDWKPTSAKARDE
jgi:serine protease Do